MTPGQIILVVAVAAAVGFGLFRMRTDGRFATARAARTARTDTARPDTSKGEPTSDVAAGGDGGTPTHGVLDDTPFADQLGERATLLQFSSAFCAPCHVTRRILGEVAEVVPGVNHLEVDAEAHLELVRRVGVMRTPTTLILDERGVEIARAAGAPRKEQVLAALGQAVAD